MAPTLHLECGSKNHKTGGKADHEGEAYSDRWTVPLESHSGPRDASGNERHRNGDGQSTTL